MTSIFYNKNCGLILSSFSGFMEIFDCLTLNFSVWNNQKMSRKQDNGVGGSISTVDFSEALDMIAYGGVSGRIHFLDQTTKNFKGTIDAHSHEVIMLKFYDA
jgi:WD40 repeat protein